MSRSRPLRWAPFIAAMTLTLAAAASCRRQSQPPLRPRTVTPEKAGDTPLPRPASPSPGRPVAAVDVTAQARAANSAKYQRPPGAFRSVHVKPRSLPRSALRKNSGGFTVALPSRAAVATPAVYGGMVFVSGGFRSKQFYAFDARTGEAKWGVDLGDDGPSTPACEDGICVFNTESCTLFALDAETGKKRWAWWLGDPQMSAPTIARGRVFSAYPARRRRVKPQNLNTNVQLQGVPSQLGAVVRHQRQAKNPKPLPPGMTHAIGAFELKTGRLLWRVWIDGDVLSAPVAAGKELYLTTFTGTIYKLDQATGRILAAEKARATSAPIVVGEDVFYTQRSDRGGSAKARESLAWQNRSNPRQKRLYQGRRAAYLDARVQRKSAYFRRGRADDTANGFAGGAPSTANAQVAENNIGQASVSNLQAFQGSRTLRFRGRNYNTMGDEVIATDPRTGRKAWSVRVSGSLKKAGGALAAPPVAAGAYLFVALLKGEVLQLDPTTGRVVKRYPVGHRIRSQPVIAGGWMYLGTQDGRLVAIDTGDRSLTGWPQWGANAARTGVR